MTECFMHKNFIIIALSIFLFVFENHLTAYDASTLPEESIVLLNEISEACINAQHSLDNLDDATAQASLHHAEEAMQALIEMQPALQEKDLLSLVRKAIRTKKSASVNNWLSNPYISKKAIKLVKPWIIPDSHPAKPILDALFTSSRVTASDDTLIAAGFTILYSQPRSFIRVVRHPLLPGYLIKLYPDSELRQKKNQPDWYWFAQRCAGAQKIAKILKKKKIKHFTVAKKWIYPLPAETSPPNSRQYQRKNFILLVEDMQLVSREENKDAWKYVITPQHLKEFHTVITAAKGSSYRASNVPFTMTGKFAFIDTEYPEKKTNYDNIKPYLSPEMLATWEQIVKSKGKK